MTALTNQEPAKPQETEPPTRPPEGDLPKLNNKELKKEAIRQRALVKDMLYPILLKHAKNIKDAKNICHTLIVGLELLKDEKLKDVKGLIDGMEKELQRLTDKEELTRPLIDLKTEFL